MSCEGGGEIFNFAVGINGRLLDKVEVEDLVKSLTFLEKVEVEELKMSPGGGAKSSTLLWEYMETYCRKLKLRS